jgi:hypothetical protein
MARQSVQLQSSALRSADYDDETQQLDVTFNSGQTYTYERVPAHVFEQLSTASSPGTYFFQNVKGRF